MRVNEGGPGLARIGDDEVGTVGRAIASRRLTRYADGDETSATYRLERAIAARLGSSHCLALNSGSAAQLVSLWSLDLEPGTEVLVPAFCFASCFSTIALAGCTPVLVEVDESLGMCPADAASKVTDRTSAIVVAHMLGRPTALTMLVDLCARLGVPLIEDAAQALGAQLDDRAIGTIGTIGIFSLNPFKVITAGDGGLLVTADTSLYERAFALHDHGARPFRAGVAGSGPMMGLNLRINELGAALAEAQVGQLDEILHACRSASEELMRCLELPAGVRVNEIAPGGRDCGSAVVLTFDEPAGSAAFARAMGTHTMETSGKHCYAEIPQLREWAFPRSVPRPSPSRLDSYRPGALPQTDDVLRRTVCLGVGVHDSYLGTGAGVSVRGPVRQAAERISATLVRSVDRG